MKVLLVDDDEPFRSRMARALTERGCTVIVAQDLTSARHRLDKTPDAALVDLRMPGESGLEVVREIHLRYPAARIVMLTGYGSITTAVEAVKLGASQYLTKPAALENVIAALKGEADAPAEETPSLDRIEWEHIQRVLNDCDGNVSEAARRLGMHRRSLQRKLNRRAPLD
ncbi:MAG: response regulator [Planctomycetota bacterium]